MSTDARGDPGVDSAGSSAINPGFMYDYSQREPRLPAPVDRSLADADIDMETRIGMYRTLHEL
ncbi:MAG TPA: hypothetical protein VI141_00305, partial [Acidimicrobiia bacterium]